MKPYLILLFFIVLAIPLQAQDQIPSYSFEQLEERIRVEAKKQAVVVNFWATWCAPCIKELPHFESLQSEYDQSKVKVLLVSLDMEKERAVKYAQKKQLKSDIAYLDEVDFNQWIDKISPDWSGAIPATLMLSPDGKKSFYEGEFSKEELYQSVNDFLQKTD